MNSYLLYVHQETGTSLPKLVKGWRSAEKSVKERLGERASGTLLFTRTVAEFNKQQNVEVPSMPKTTGQQFSQRIPLRLGESSFPALVSPSPYGPDPAREQARLTRIDMILGAIDRIKDGVDLTDVCNSLLQDAIDVAPTGERMGDRMRKGLKRKRKGDTVKDRSKVDGE